MKTYKINIIFSEWYIRHIIECFGKCPNNENGAAYEIGNQVISQLVMYVREHPNEFTNKKSGSKSLLKSSKWRQFVSGWR